MTLPSTGPWSYNRFAALDELKLKEQMYFMEQKKKLDPVGKEDADIDNDGDVDKSDSYLHNRRKAIGKAMGKKGKKDMKESCDPSCECKKCSKKKDMNEWIHGLVDEGYDLSGYTMEEMEDIYDEALAELAEETEEEMTIEEAVCGYLIDNGFANNWVSAEVVLNNMSEDWLNDVVNQIDEATAMAKRGYNETTIRKKIGRAGGGESADRATALADKETFGRKDVDTKARQRLARKQRGDFRKTASSNPGLHGYGYKSNDPKVKAKQDARGMQRSPLTPKEKKSLGY